MRGLLARLTRLTRLPCPSLAALLLACVPVRPFMPPLATEPGPVATPAPAPAPAPVSPPAAEPLPVCRVDPPPPTLRSLPPASCIPVPTALQRRTRARLAADFFTRMPGARLITQFECDPLAAPAELIHESGHNGDVPNLRLLRLRWHADNIDVLSIRLQRSLEDPDVYELQVQRGSVPEPLVSRMLPELRALLLARLTETLPPDTRQSIGFRNGHTWHGRLRLVDGAARALEHHFTGSNADSNQLTRLPVVQSSARMLSILQAVQWQTAVAIDADVRTFFVARFLATVPADARWVTESMVRLAADLGTPALVPALLPLAQDDAAGDSHRRLRTHALAALAALTGFDARNDAHGDRLPEAAAAALYTRACAQAVPSGP